MVKEPNLVVDDWKMEYEDTGEMQETFRGQTPIRKTIEQKYLVFVLSFSELRTGKEKCISNRGPEYKSDLKLGTRKELCTQNQDQNLDRKYFKF